MKKIAIKPHKTRGIELIEILERMGGHNSHHLDGFSFRDDTAYLINENGIITSYTEHLCHEKGYKIYTLEEWEDEYKSDEMIEGLVEDENKDMDKELRKCKSDFKYWVDNYMILPDGYVFKDENGNLIYANKIILEKKKKEYPKTYCECKDILGLWDIDDTERGYYKTDLIDKLQMLLICRDAYWKIAGEEMGLEKPWEPDCENENQVKYIIGFWLGTIQCLKENYVSHPFAFPTEEIRDAFYENFKKLIEECKELL